MKALFTTADCRSDRTGTPRRLFRTHAMPRRYLCVLPSRSRPGLFSGD